jgi:hypothetical protein
MGTTCTLLALMLIFAISDFAGREAAGWFSGGILIATIATLFDDWRTFHRKDRP